jgi:hypothetical protein
VKITPETGALSAVERVNSGVKDGIDAGVGTGRLAEVRI